MRIALTVTVLFLVYACPARGATVTAEIQEHVDRHGSVFVEGQVRFDAAPGERNVVVVTGTSLSLRFSDSGTAPNPGKGCVADGQDAVLCMLPPNRADKVNLQVDTGDGDDALTVDRIGTAVMLDVGDGDDVLTLNAARSEQQFASLDGRAGDDVIIGGDGDDWITPGSGADTVLAGAGNDWVSAGEDGPAPSSDRLDGGPDTDRILYGGRARGVVVDLLRPDGAGEPGENDRLSGFEDIRGSGVGSVLLGDEGPNLIEAVSGRDNHLVGRGGNDRLDGGPSSDTIEGGDGDDRILGFGGLDRLDGGAGSDRVLAHRPGRAGPAVVRCSGPEDRVDIFSERPVKLQTNCSRVVASNMSLVLRRAGTGHVQALAVGWRSTDRPRPCRFRATFTRAGRTLQTIRTGPLSRSTDRRAAVRARGRAVVTVAFDDDCHGRFHPEWRRDRFETVL